MKTPRPSRPAGLKSQIGVGGIVLGAREKKYLRQVIASNRLSYGPLTRRFEEEFARAHSCRFGLFCNSGTSALHVALAALKEQEGWRDGDEVLVPAVTFVATSNIVLHNGMKPVFVDVDKATYNLDPTLLERRVTPRTRAIIPVHLLGLPCDMDPILELARERGLKIIEDSCETMFARYKGRMVGSMGDIGCFSTYIAHYIVTGVGGLAVTQSPDLAVRLRSLMNHGRDSIYISIDDDQGVKGERLKEIVAKRFSFISVGHSFRATELEAAIGLGQFEGRGAIIKARQANARRLSDGLKDLQDRLQLPSVPADRDHMFMMYGLALRSEDKTGLVNFLEEHDIETRDLMPLINQPVYKRMYGDLEKDYPVARWLNRSAFYIGCHQYLSRRDLDYIVECIHDYFRRR
ncbi:MAG: DegT/DnrJ/EryC1/StrS family aminotransferase [Elusimicrobia bacterium]|nr:DegT/DnrJ/EryC1/StrS family aminotransferase [Elusimicrobiota bacterium]